VEGGREGIVAIVTGQAGSGKTTIVRATCELIAHRTGQQVVQLELDDFIFGVIDPSCVSDPTAPPDPARLSTALQMTAAACLAGASSSGWVVLDGFVREHSLEYLRANLPISMTYGLEALLGTCWERNEGRDPVDRLPQAMFDRLWSRFDVADRDDICWLDSTLPVDTLAEQLATRLVALGSEPAGWLPPGGLDAR